MNKVNADNNKYDWNDYVAVLNNAPISLHPGEQAYIVGMQKVNNLTLAKKHNTPIGQWIYTIEFNDGSDITLSEKFLEKVEDNSQNTT